MADNVVDPHDKMRSRNVYRTVATGKQAPRPPHEPGTISDGPPAPDDGTIDVLGVGTAPVDVRFPTTNQARHCYARYLEYHGCRKVKGEEAPECEKFARYYRSLCPTDWVLAWNEQTEKGICPGPI